ncbi:MAG TPA: hypothetical protein VLK55_01375 [Kocuria rosea]|nr:hypothetical protein [Kocuria rosea]
MVLCTAYEPAGPGVVVLVRREADGHRLGALVRGVAGEGAVGPGELHAQRLSSRSSIHRWRTPAWVPQAEEGGTSSVG